MISLYEFMAWVIDFEGCINLRKFITKSSSISYQPQVRVNGTSKLLLERFKLKIGLGSVDNGRDPENSARIYNWRLTTNEIRVHLPLIEPFFILKRRQAQLIIESLSILQPKNASRKGQFGRLSQSEIYTQDQLNKLEQIYWEVRKLNQKNKPEELTDAEKLFRLFQPRGIS